MQQPINLSIKRRARLVSGWMRFNATGDSSTRSLLATIFAELVIPGREFVWTASLLYPLTRLGITEHAARRGIGRIAANGWIENDKVGREVRWRLTDSGVRLIDEITRRASSLQHQPERWDGRCVVLSITVPRDKKNVRRPLYTALGWAGFGNPMPGLWASPHVDRLAEARSVIHELGLRDSAVCLVGTTARVGLSDPDIVQRAWDLKDIGDRYRTLLETFEGLQPEPGDDSLLAYLTLVNEWRKFPYIDPQLPQDLLPDWIGRRAVAAFAELHRRWRPEAITRWAEILRETRPRDE